ncbi:MAG: lactonase family protein [Clostridiales bacterium]|jgi:6-phosphogluconolactonase|nr:lactonase family protein [Clostridiales bacterium]
MRKTNENSSDSSNLKKCEARLYFGTYTSYSQSAGIYVYAISEEGKLRKISTCGDCENPSYLAMGAGVLYSSDEIDGKGRISSYAIGNDGCLTRIGSSEFTGSGLCHISIWPNGQWISGANYNEGSFTTCEIIPDRSVGKVSHSFTGDATGVDPLRQQKQHAHCIVASPDGRIMAAADLGGERLYLFDTNIHTGELSLRANQPWVETKPGEGPRHFVFSGDGMFGYLLTEMGNSIYIYSIDNNGYFKEIQIVSTLPSGNKVRSAAAAIKISPDGRYIYASNRGADNIVCYAIAKDGALSEPSFYPAHGRAPRDFCLSPCGRFAVITNQDSGDVFVVKRDIDNGTLGEVTDTTKIPQVSCVIWVLKNLT